MLPWTALAVAPTSALFVVPLLPSIHFALVRILVRSPVATARKVFATLQNLARTEWLLEVLQLTSHFYMVVGVPHEQTCLLSADANWRNSRRNAVLLALPCKS